LASATEGLFLVVLESLAEEPFDGGGRGGDEGFVGVVEDVVVGVDGGVGRGVDGAVGGWKVGFAAEECWEGG